MAKGQETQRQVGFVVQAWNAHVVRQNGGVEVGVAEHHTLWQASGAGSVDEHHQVGWQSTLFALVQKFNIGIFAPVEKFFPSHADFIVGTLLNERIVGDHIFQ